MESKAPCHNLRLDPVPGLLAKWTANYLMKKWLKLLREIISTGAALLDKKARRERPGFRFHIQTLWNYGLLLSLHSCLLSKGFCCGRNYRIAHLTHGMRGMKCFVTDLLTHCLAMVLMKPRSQLWLTDRLHCSKVFCSHMSHNCNWSIDRSNSTMNIYWVPPIHKSVCYVT